jgi:hypothetical protein
MESFSVNNLTTFLNGKKFNIDKIYSINGSCSFIRVVCNVTGNDFIISIPSKYPMRINSNSTELIKFTDIDVNDNYHLDSKNTSGNYGEIKINGLEDDKLYLNPEEADKLLEQYQSIDIDSEKSDILKKNITNYKIQLDRLKFSTSGIKYKLCIVSNSSFCTITRINDIECYAIKRGIPENNENKDLCIIIDLENFYDKVDSIYNDINRVYNNLYEIMSKSHTTQTNLISSRIRQYSILPKSLIDKYKKKNKYEETIKSLNGVLLKIRGQEVHFKKQFSIHQKESGLSSSYKSFSIKKLEDDYEKLIKFREDSIKLLREIKYEYNNFLLNFDYSLFDSIKLFNKMTNNFIKLGVLPDCKK